MLNFFKSIIFNTQEQEEPKTPIQHFMIDNEMTFHGYGGLCINNLVVSEFNYLFHYYSNTSQSLIEFPEILDMDFTPIKNKIYQEINSGHLIEVKSLNISNETAIANVKNLLIIINTLEKYKIKCDELGIKYTEGQNF